MKKMTSDEFKSVGKNVLKFLDKVCRENNIKYFLSSGSLIGAIRHKGYIPWDDDIDVCMLRDDYNRFIEVMKNETEYYIISIETDPDYYFPFARLSDKHTQLNLRGMREIHNFGVFVDVFPIDNAPPKEEREAWFDEYKDIRKKVGYTIPGSAHYREHSLKTCLRILRCLPKRIKWGTKNFDLYRKQMQKHVTIFGGEGNDDKYKIATECANVYGLDKAIFPKEIFEETTTVEFEGMQIMTSKRYDEFLRITYGDYMQLPPVEKRVSQHHFDAYWKGN